MQFLFDLFYLLTGVILAPWLIWRAARTGRYRQHFAAKLLGRVEASPAHRTVWFHGVSVGEIHLLVTLVAAFRKKNPDWRIVVSSTTDTGLAEARSKFPDLVVIPYPFDFSWACGEALDRVRPAVVVLAESELWPNFLAAAGERKIPVVVANGRISPRTFRRMMKVKSLLNRVLFRHVTTFAVQTEEYADRLRQLGVRERQIRVTGSIKFDGATGDRNTLKGRELERVLANRGRQNPGAESGPPVHAGRSPELLLVAGSTHAPEEAILLGVFTKLRSTFPQLRLLLVPRHPDRFNEVADLIQKSGLTFARRSHLTEPPEFPPPVVLLDTVGELGAAWGLAELGYTGGSLDGQRGGQSMIEPAGYGVPVVFGPHVWNFRDPARLLVDAGAAVMVKSADELEAAFAGLLLDADRRRRMGDTARRLVKEQQGATERTVDLISETAGRAE
ncbi:MAG: 3-deoxy-D-manno-octulosonic acid transferase [Fimbriiglobus sp.]|nr:3-deoxy-D-manno-octulosonic acid transferase [Fimbriiglobus sp.]